jgi:hypothetical protein
VNRLELACSMLAIGTAAVAGYVTAGSRAEATPSAHAIASRPGSSASPMRGTAAVRARSMQPHRGQSRAELQTALMSGDSFHGMFDRESRDDKWADAVEHELRAPVENFVHVLMPFAENPRFECRATTCQIEITVPKERFHEASSLLQGLPLGNAIEPNAEDLDDQPGKMRIEVTSVYEAEQLDEREIGRWFDAKLTERFTTDLAATRTYLDQHPEAFDDNAGSSR